MVRASLSAWVGIGILLCIAASARAEQKGSIRGMVKDKDFSDAPLKGSQVEIMETGQKAIAAEGSYRLDDVAPGTYTLVFSMEGYTRQVKGNVVVSAGKMTEVDGELVGEWEDMKEFVVREPKLGGGTEEKILLARAELPQNISGISKEIIKAAGASTAADSISLVSGTTTQDGKYAVVRGLPDRYVNSQMNGVRLPSADPDKRAVQLDQFPSAIIESIQVSKTFMPDQQGDASGGAVNIMLTGVPNESFFKFDVGSSYRTTSPGKGEFLTHKDGEVNWLGMDKVPLQAPGIYSGVAGVSYDDASIPYNWSMAGGLVHKFDTGIKVGAFGSLFYKRETTQFEDGIDDTYWVESPGAPMTPTYGQGTPTMGDFYTHLFDVKQSTELIRWGGMGGLGLESKNHKLAAVYLFTQNTDNTTTLAEDTRGKSYYFPGYDVSDANSEANKARYGAPWQRNETLKYTERDTSTLQFTGKHTLEVDDFGIEDLIIFKSPQFDWTTAFSSSGLYQPDKRQFGSAWLASYRRPAIPPRIPAKTFPSLWVQKKDAANYTLGNFQQVWKDVSEESTQCFLNLKFPFTQWSGDEGYFKFGVFNDDVDRQFNQDSFSNFSDPQGEWQGDWSEFWSAKFPGQNHTVSAADIDVDYEGKQKISAFYYMADVPVSSWLKFVGGVRYEKTDLSITLTPEKDVTWIPPSQTVQVRLNPGDADVAFQQDDVLPAIGFELTPLRSATKRQMVTLRGSYSRTVARQTFKELTPIQQMEYLGSDVFVGNPELQMSALENWDLRLDYMPYEGSLLSASWFRKDITNPIEYVQRIGSFAYTTPMNYPKGTLSGIELEARQHLGTFLKELEGLTVGGNATFIDSEVTLPAAEAAQFDEPNIRAPMKKRDMTNAPEHLYNLFTTYDIKKTGTQLGLFYTVRGDTLVAGAGTSSGFYIPNVYDTQFGTLNFSVSQRLDKIWKLRFVAKNLTNPKIQRVYRSDHVDGDTVKTSYRKGMEFSITLSAEF